MKIAQFYNKNRLRLGLIEDNGLNPVDFPGDMIDFIKTKPDIKPSGRPLPLDQVHFASAVSRPPKIIGSIKRFTANSSEVGPSNILKD